MQYDDNETDFLACCFYVVVTENNVGVGRTDVFHNFSFALNERVVRDCDCECSPNLTVSVDE